MVHRFISFTVKFDPSKAAVQRKDFLAQGEKLSFYSRTKSSQHMRIATTMHKHVDYIQNVDEGKRCVDVNYTTVCLRGSTLVIPKSMLATPVDYL